MKFGVDIGHNCSPDTGASGIKQEDALTKAVGKIVIQNLKAAGHEVINCTPISATSVNNSLRQRVEKANQAEVDLFVSIHFNAFNGRANGTEVFAISEIGKRYAQAVLNKIVELGFNARYVKNGNHLYVLNNTKMPAILIECCFCDSSVDMAKFDAQRMADAITQGLKTAIPSNIQQAKV